MAKKDYSKNHEKDYQALYEDYEASLQEIKELKEINKDLRAIVASTNEIKSLLEELKKINKELVKNLKEKDEKINKLTEQNQKLVEEIQRLRNNNKKDSSNSSKPSSTNGSKKIPNSREKSNRKQGGQANHMAHTLKAKDVEKLIEDKANVKYVKKTIKEIKKKCPKYVIDLCIKLLVTENNCDNIDKLNEVQYGNEIKSIVVLLATDCYMSYDSIVKFISAITNNKISLSKGTVVNWINEFSNNLKDEDEAMKADIIASHYNNSDDSIVKGNGENYYQLCICNGTTVKLYFSESKNREAWENTILPLTTGVIVKDGTRVYDNLDNNKAQCCAHIIRYLKGSYELSDFKHVAPNKLIDLLRTINNHRNNLKEKNINSFTKEEITKYSNEYDELIKLWEKELEGESEIIYKDEINLFERMKGKDKKEILYFMNDFQIPFTNNNAESAQRGIKVKQKIGKFRSKEGAKSYCQVKSFVLTIKKRKIPVFESIKNIFTGIPVLAK